MRELGRGWAERGGGVPESDTFTLSLCFSLILLPYDALIFKEGSSFSFGIYNFKKTKLFIN